MKRTELLLRYTAVMDEAVTFNTQNEWKANANNLKGRSPNAILIRNIATVASALTIVVQGALIQPQTEMEFKCHDPGGVWNINEFIISYPGEDCAFEFITVCHTNFYYEEVEVRS